MSARRLELRGMTPPEPMILILSALTSLGRDEWLEAALPHEPGPLYAILVERGWTHEILAQEPGLCLVKIRRAE